MGNIDEISSRNSSSRNFSTFVNPRHARAMSTFAITGANGFIASNLTASLVAKGHTVRGTIRSSDESKTSILKANGAEPYIVSDLTDEAAMTAAFKGCDGVFHLAAVHPQYGFADTPIGRQGMIAAAVEGVLTVLRACKAAGVKRVVLTSSLAAVECGNDEGTLSESTWSKADVYDAPDNLEKTQWNTHFTYVKSKTEQERAALAFAKEHDLDLRVIVPGNLVVGPIASEAQINGTMTRLRDIMQGTNTLKGAADLGVTHVFDVVEAHERSMTVDSASGRYLVSPDMVKLEELFNTLKSLYPSLPVASMTNMDIASGLSGKARKVEATRTIQDLSLQFKPLEQSLKDAVDSMLLRNLIAVPSAA